MFEYLIGVWEKVKLAIGMTDELVDKLEDVAGCVDEVIENLSEKKDD